MRIMKEMSKQDCVLFCFAPLGTDFLPSHQAYEVLCRGMVEDAMFASCLLLKLSLSLRSRFQNAIDICERSLKALVLDLHGMILNHIQLTHCQSIMVLLCFRFKSFSSLETRREIGYLTTLARLGRRH